ncbi:MAG: amidohydrolase [Gluconacetobacter liquefaciens]
MHADTIMTGGKIFRGLGLPLAEAVAISGTRIVAVGSDALVFELAGPATRRIDLGGRLAVPGFNDAHQHPLPLGLMMGQVNLRPEYVRTLDQLLEAIRAEARRLPPGQWIQGRGYDDSVLDVERPPTLDELSAAAPDHPVIIFRLCGHVGMANRAALAVAGLTAETPDPEGGALGRDASGLTGLIQERAKQLLTKHIPRPTTTELVEAVDRVSSFLNSQGYTAVMDAGIGFADGMEDITAYRAARDSGALSVRLWGCLFGNPEGIADAAWEAGVRPGSGCEMLRFGAMKVFADGSAGGRTAAMTEPYLQGGHGLLCFDDAQMHGLLAKYHAQGWQLAIHAIGDAGIAQVIAGMRKAATPEQPLAGRRHRIEHCGFLTPAQMAEMATFGIEVVPQPIFLYESGETYITNVGRARAERSYPMASWLREGFHPAASSDAPVSTTDPFLNLQTMVTRRTFRGTVMGGDETIDIAQALHCLTYNGAHSQFSEHRRGRILPGMDADITVLSRDLLSIPAEDIAGTQADLVLLDGRIVHDRQGEVS